VQLQRDKLACAKKPEAALSRTALGRLVLHAINEATVRCHHAHAFAPARQERWNHLLGDHVVGRLPWACEGVRDAVPLQRRRLLPVIPDDHDAAA
jgi:hypothetical protein